MERVFEIVRPLVLRRQILEILQTRIGHNLLPVSLGEALSNCFVPGREFDEAIGDVLAPERVAEGVSMGFSGEGGVEDASPALPASRDGGFDQRTIRPFRALLRIKLGALALISSAIRIGASQ